MLTKAFSRNVIGFVTWKNDWFARLGIPYRFGYEPFRPQVVTQFPGALHEASSERSTGAASYDGSSQTAHRFIDLKMCKNNFIMDTDGNRILDLTCPIALGYNHDQMILKRLQEDYDRFLSGRVNCSSIPPSDFADMLRELVMPVAPRGHTSVHLADGTISGANESAVRHAMHVYASSHGRDLSNVVAMGFEKGSHGGSLAMLSLSDAAVNHAGLPTIQWPKCPLPQMQYPLSRFEHENAAEEQRCLAKFEEIITAQKASGHDVGAVIIEPITSYENRSAIPMFYKKLRAVCAREGIPFIVDETRSGYGQTGKLWAHDYWYLNENDGGAPDMVTFGGKAGISGFYSTTGMRGDHQQNVDMVKLLNFGFGWKTMQSRDLFEKVLDVSQYLKIELKNVERDRDSVISRVRGNGSMIGFDAQSPQATDSIVSWLQKSGIQVARVGPSTLGLRPALVLGAQHACHLRSAMLAYHPNHDKK